MRNSEYAISTPEMIQLKQEQWLRIAGVNVVSKEDKENAINGKQKDSVREETSAVSSTTRISVQNRHQKPLHPLNHQHTEVEVCRGNAPSDAEASLGSPTDSRAKTPWKVLALNYFVTIGILPNVSFMSESGCKFGDMCSFAKRQVEGQPSKKLEKRWWSKCSGNIEKCTTVGLRSSGHGAAIICIYFSEGPKSF